MTARNTKGVQICMTTDAASSTIVPTAITAAKPAALTVAASTLQAGDIIFVDKTGTKLDGKWWAVGATSTATSVVLLGSDNTGGATTVGATAVFNVRTGVGSMVCLCLSAFSIQRDTPGTVSVGTFCDPSASIPASVTQAGTVSIGGYVDVTADDFKAVIAAEEAGKPHTFRVTLPDNGYILFEGIISGFAYDIPVDGPLAWTATIALSGAPRHLF